MASTGSGKSLRIPGRFATIALGIPAEVDFERRVGYEEAAFDGIPDVVHAVFEGVVPDRFGEVVLELPFALERLLRNVGVGAERSARKSHQRSADVARDQVVPVLESRR